MFASSTEMTLSSKLHHSYHLLLLIFCLSFTNQLTYCADNIIPGQPISGNETITSSNGAFVLGFFKPGTSDHNFYLAIRFKTVINAPIVWIANRDTPVSDPNSSKLKIAEDGNLVITDNNTRIWSTNVTSFSANSTQALLSDNGNLVLTKWPSSSVEGKSSSPALWQSFDQPTDTLLPGGKIGLSKLTNKIYMLTSWRSGDDPSQGRFTRQIDFTGGVPRLVLLNGSEVYQNYIDRYWSLNGIAYFSDEKESYFSYNPPSQKIIQLDFSGKIKVSDPSYSSVVDISPISPSTTYGAYAICDESSLPVCKCVTGLKPKNVDQWSSGYFDSGCVRTNPVGCQEMKEDSFLGTDMLKLYSGQIINMGNVKECRRKCLNDCKCTAYADNGNSCLIFHGDLMFMAKYNMSEKVIGAYYRLPKVDQDDVSVPKKTIVGIAVGALPLLGFLLILLSIYRKNKAMAAPEPVDKYITAFSSSYLKKATKNFSEKLGEGGFGSVYKGQLPYLTYIAVKKLKLVNKGEEQFRNEVKTIGVVQHVNLIRLRGFCAEKTHRLLVYEYMPKGSLDFYLSSKRTQVLDWETRYKIAIGAAQGLAYLHESCRECIIHCDVKPANILLDEEFNPKVADFGLAKLFDRDFSRVLTTMRGTPGYIAPEWLSGAPITPKVDVFSYGLMPFEIISGRRNVEIIADSLVDYFPTRAVNITNRGEEVIGLLDCKLKGNANMEELTRALRVACWCIQDDAEDRPPMKLIAQILQGVVHVGVPPVPRFIQTIE